jgi:hypothetical protein
MIATSRPAWEQFTRLYYATRDASLTVNPRLIATMDTATFRQLGRDLERGGTDVPSETAARFC